MIQRQHTKFVQAAISILPEVSATAPNTPYDEAAEFETILCDPVLPMIPEPELVDDSDQVGDGTEGPKDPRPGATPSTALTLSSKLNNRWNSRMLKRFMAGAQTDDVVSAGAVWDHEVDQQLRTSYEPQLTTIAMILGGADPILSSMGVNTVTLAQQGTEAATISFELMGSGHFKEFRDAYRVQVITVTGTPTGGEVVTDFDGQPLTIPFDASAASLLILLEALSNIAVGDVSVSGGPLPGTPLVITFLSTGAWVNEDVPLITITTNSLTGGTTPAMAITAQTPYLTLPAAPDYTGRYMHPIALTASLNDGTAIELCDLGILNHSVQMTQNLEWTSLPCVDQFRVAGDKRSGTYMGLVSRGERQVRPSFELYLDGAVAERYWKRKNTSITALKFTHQGERIGATAYYHEFELEIPLSKAMALEIGSSGNWGTKKISFLPKWSGGFVHFRSRSSEATLT